MLHHFTYNCFHMSVKRHQIQYTVTIMPLVSSELSVYYTRLHHFIYSLLAITMPNHVLASILVHMLQIQHKTSVYICIHLHAASMSYMPCVYSYRNAHTHTHTHQFNPTRLQASALSPPNVCHELALHCSGIP